MLQSIIQSSNRQKEYPIVNTYSVTDLYRVGDRRSVFPSVIWNDYRTFFAANKENIGFNNKIQVFQKDHKFNSFHVKEAGQGTDEFDEFNHPLTAIWEENDYIYCCQTNTHNDIIEVYKSNLKNDIRSGFTLINIIQGENAYPQIFKTVSGKTAFCVRQFPEGVGNFNLSVQLSDSGIEGTFTKIVITENTDGYRHYNIVPIKYGTSTKNFLFSCLRNDNAGNVYFSQAIYETSDFDTYRNIDGSFSKTISVSGELTMEEISTHCIVNGSIANDTVNFEIANVIQINDVLYFTSIKAGTSVRYIFKIENGLLESFVLNISNLFQIGRNPILYSNGVNPIVSCITDDNGDKNREIWAVSSDCSFFSQQFIWEGITGSNHIFLPDNFDKVRGEYEMLVEVNPSNSTLKTVTNTNRFLL